MDTLDVMFPEHKVTLVDGSELLVKPFTFGQLPKALKLSKSLFGLIKELYTASPDERSALIGEVLSSGGEDLIELLALSVGKPRAWFDTLRADDGLKLTTAFVEINVSFFAQKVIPEFTRGMDQLKASGVGGKMVQARESLTDGKTSSST